MERISSDTNKTCSTCHYRSDDFTSVCVNPDSEHAADFVMADDTCPQYKERMSDFCPAPYEIPVDTQVIMDDLRRLEEKIREIVPPKIVIIHPETALTFHDGEIEKSQRYLCMDVVISELVPPGEVMTMNEAEYNKWRDAHMPTEETDEERFQKKKEEAYRTYPCRICGTRYESKSEAKQCARSHDWQNRRGRR